MNRAAAARYKKSFLCCVHRLHLLPAKFEEHQRVYGIEIPTENRREIISLR